MSTDRTAIIYKYKLVGDMWNLLIIRSLINGPKRNNELCKEIPEIGSSTLATKLKHLEEEGIITRTQYNEIPPRVVYCLTKKGRKLESILVSLELLDINN